MDDIILLIKETEAQGTEIPGCFGRAYNEYWLVDAVLNNNKPTPGVLKLAAIIPVCKHKLKRELSLTETDLKRASWQINKTDTNDIITSYSDEDIQRMLKDAKISLPAPTFQPLNVKIEQNPGQVFLNG